jgi:hypothetical protein
MTVTQKILEQHHKSVADKVRFLDSSHLRDDLKHIPQMFEDLANKLLHHVPSSPELTIAMQKLVEAKDQAVRAQIHATENSLTPIATGSSSDNSGTDVSASSDQSVSTGPAQPADGAPVSSTGNNAAGPGIG